MELVRGESRRRRRKKDAGIIFVSSPKTPIKQGLIYLGIEDSTRVTPPVVGLFVVGLGKSWLNLSQCFVLR